jgi:hypothetical protein
MRRKPRPADAPGWSFPRTAEEFVGRGVTFSSRDGSFRRPRRLIIRSTTPPKPAGWRRYVPSSISSHRWFTTSIALGAIPAPCSHRQIGRRGDTAARSWRRHPSDSRRRRRVVRRVRAAGQTAHRPSGLGPPVMWATTDALTDIAGFRKGRGAIYFFARACRLTR